MLHRLSAWRWAAPVLLIAIVDPLIRWRQVPQWNPWEDLFYVASILFVLAWTRVVAGLIPRRERHPQLYWAIVLVLGFVSGFALLVHFDYYFYFGVHPEIIALGHLFGETAETTSIIWDELTLTRMVAGVALIAFSIGGWRVATDVRPGRKGFWTAVVLFVLMLPAFHQNVAMSQGNFLPSVNLFFTVSRAAQSALTGKGAYRRMQVSARLPVPQQPHKLPYNVLILVNESLRAEEVSYNGYSRATTPNVDAFMKAHPGQSFNFARCYTNSTKTTESVPSILTGVHPVDDYLKMHRYPLFYEYAKAFPGTYSFLYASHGYDVANFRFFLRTPRLDAIIYQESSGHPRYNSLGADDKYLLPPFEKTIADLPASQPFVGILHMNGPHFPYRVPDERQQWGAAQRLDEYDNSIRYQDETIGGFLHVLEAHGRLANTIIFSTSDHGEAFNEHHVNGHRWTFYEEIIHVPCWMYLPEKLAQRYGATLRANEPVNMTNLDWVPTLVDLLELNKVPEVAALMAQIQGHSLVQPLDPERIVLVQNGTNGQRISDGFAVVKGPWRLLDHPLGKTPRIELYNVATDAGERNDQWPAASTARRTAWRDVVSGYPLLAKHAIGLLARGDGLATDATPSR